MRVERAAGVWIDKHLDFTSGWLVANIGHDNPRVRRAMHKARGWAVIDGHPHPLRQAAEDALRSILPPHLSWIGLYNSGSEAMDVAIRLASGPVFGHPRAFHGSTIGAQMLPRVDFAEWLRKGVRIPSGTVLLETFHGPWCEWHPPALIDKLRARQAKGDIRLIFDEMQAGFGRTGRWWGFEHYGIEPDIVVGGKAVASGFPMAFVAARPELAVGHPNWESTFSGNALACAACMATIQEIERRRLLEHVRALEPLIQRHFPQAQGKGFAYAFEHPDAEAVVKHAFKWGLLLLNTGRGTVKIAPPLVISETDLRRGLAILRDCI